MNRLSKIADCNVPLLCTANRVAGVGALRETPVNCEDACRDDLDGIYHKAEASPFETAIRKPGHREALQPRPPGRLWLLVVVLATVVTTADCGRTPARHAPVPPPSSPSQVNSTSTSSSLLPHIELPQPSQRLGTAVVILIDTSGSMDQTVRDHAGHPRTKDKIAREALQRIMTFTDAWQSKHPETPLFLGISSFSSDTSEVLKMGPFDSTKAAEAVRNIPHPGGGTAIGKALSTGFMALYSTGCVRKHLVCITDGNNTVGTPPDLVARQLYSQTHGDVEMHFVAFDTSVDHFGFLKSTGGSVFEAADANQLQTRLTEIYEKRIFAEAMPAEKQ